MRDYFLKKVMPVEETREHYLQIQRKFTDIEIASMIWNSHLSDSERKQLLYMLMAETTDMNLKLQITNQLSEGMSTDNCQDLKNFKNYPVRLDYLFERGDLVKDVVNDSYGIVTVSSKSMKRFYKRIDNGLCVDYFDSTTVTVDYASADNDISHSHTPMLYLKKITIDDVPECQREFISCAKAIIEGNGSLEYLSRRRRLPPL